MPVGWSFLFRRVSSINSTWFHLKSGNILHTLCQTRKIYVVAILGSRTTLAGNTPFRLSQNTSQEWYYFACIIFKQGVHSPTRDLFIQIFNHSLLHLIELHLYHPNLYSDVHLYICKTFFLCRNRKIRKFGNNIYIITHLCRILQQIV